MRRRASTPASRYEPLPATTQALHAFQLISASAWNEGPRARIRQAWSGRGRVLSPASGGMEMWYSAHGEELAASLVPSRSQSVAA